MARRSYYLMNVNIHQRPYHKVVICVHILRIAPERTGNETAAQSEVAAGLSTRLDVASRGGFLEFPINMLDYNI